MKALFFPVGAPAEERELPDDDGGQLRALQSLVDGWIENVGITPDTTVLLLRADQPAPRVLCSKRVGERRGTFLALIVNEEGALVPLPVNRVLYASSRRGATMLYGPIVLVRYSEEGAMVGLTPADLETWREW